MKYSIIMPMDTNRLEQFTNTKRVYDRMPQVKEFLIPTRSEAKVREYLEEHDLAKDVRLLPYTHTKGFNPSKAFNIGTRNAKYNTIIVTCPEVLPQTDLFEKLDECEGLNVVCQVWDEDEDHNITMSLVNKSFRGETPAMYFLAMFNKKDIEAINGWDEQFMLGYAYEDNDFGARWVRAELPFEVREDIQAVHQYHPRSETIANGSSINAKHFRSNNEAGIIKCLNGLRVVQ